MDAYGLLVLLVIGALAGWLAGNIMRGGGFGVLGNIAMGLLGSIVGGFIFNWLGVSPGGGWIGLLIAGLVGAVILLFVISLIKRA
ncbi:MAG: GlsB/YeaQ/YmgE family stress response membrane protein [Acidobacteria bacterium]|nr:GlsB/YeaQ/YmgE family stress response membrane protein [Acidobacteriota bacterium]